MGACFGRWALDAFDVQMYSFVIPTIVALWRLSRGEAGLIGTVTLLISLLGGWFSGTLADRFGRVRILQITILWYSDVYVPRRLCAEFRIAKSLAALSCQQSTTDRATRDDFFRNRAARNVG